MPRISLRTLVGAIGMSVAVVTAVSIPLGYGLFCYVGEADHLTEHARQSAGRLSRYIYTHDTLWQYQRVRLAELVELADPTDDHVFQRVVDARDEIVLEEGPVPAVPVLRRTAPIVVAGATVGRLDVETSLLRFLPGIGLVAAFGSVLAFGTYFALRVFPLRVLDRTLGALEGAKGEIAAANTELRTQNARFDAALTNMSQGLLMFAADGRLTVANQRFADLFGLRIEAVAPGMTFRELMELVDALTRTSAVEPPTVVAQVEDLVRKRKAGLIVFEHSDGRTISVSHRPTAAAGWVDTFDDITDRRQTEAKIAHVARHDALTGLPNRVFFYEQMGGRLAGVRKGESFAVISIDLDRFKSINDALGHPVGDQLLQCAAERMCGCVREGDIVARLGGDEFAIVQAATAGPADVTMLASRLIESIGAPFELGGHRVVVGTSVGIAIAPADGVDPGQLVKNAGLALHRAKADGGSAFRFFEPDVDARMQARRALELDLREAVTASAFELHYQPLVALKTGRITGFEALVRWRHPERGLVPPLEFVPIAEETGLIVPLGEWVLRQACAEAANWPDDVSVSVNLSPTQFKTRNLLQSVADALAASGLSAQRLVLEITELVLLRDDEATLATLHHLRGLGVKIAMDDFGTGYSSLGYLRSFPFDTIKIDQSFIRDLSTAEDSMAIVRAVVGLGKSLGIATIAEGVETVAQLECLRAEGCTGAQGFLFSPPRPAEEARMLITELHPQVCAVA